MLFRMVYRNTVLLIFGLLTVVKSFGCNDKATIRVIAQEYANTILKVNSPYFTDSIRLNKEGIGELKLTIPKETFIYLTAKSNEGLSLGRLLFCNKGYNLQIQIDHNTFAFEGKGKDANLLISECENFSIKSSNLIDEFVEKTNSIDSIIDFYNAQNAKFDEYYKIATKKYVLSSTEDYIIRNNYTARILGKKQDFARTYFSYEEAEEIGLEERFGIRNNDLFRDSILVKSGSGDLMNFLSWNFDFMVQHKLSFDELGIRKYLVAVDSLITDNSKTGRFIKEYLYYNNISSGIYHFGVTNEVELLTRQFNQKYPNSRYTKLISELGSTYDQLIAGKLAPEFKVQKANGEILNLSDLKGSVVFIDVWATWCAPCIKKMPIILQYEEEFPSVAFLYLSIDNDKERWETYLKTHTELGSSLNLISGNSGFESNYRVSSVPRYILINEEGIIVNAFIAKDDAEIHEILKTNTK